MDIRVRNEHYASPKYALKITVKANEQPVNQPPMITGHVKLKTEQDTPLKIALSHLQVTDPDDQYPNGFTLTVLPGDNYEVQGTTITPGNGFAGTLSVTVVVNDGDDDSAPFVLAVIVSEKPAVNIPPRITGQVPLNISVNQSVTIVFSHLLVADPDDTYPSGFILNVFPGAHYSFSGTTVTPDVDFAGELLVNVSVYDGQAESERYQMKITVVTAPNRRPVITGQAGIKIPEGETFTLQFSHLVVEDPDNNYPQDFSLQVSEGDDYTVSNLTIRPVPGFRGTLSVPVTVHDGKVSSDPFLLRIQVVPNDRLEIIGQQPLDVPEDSAVAVGFSDLRVHDPTGGYPDGFKIEVLQGENYDVIDGHVKPHTNFFGNLTVPVTVSNAGRISPPFPMLIVVIPVNDPPEIQNVDATPLHITGSGPWSPFPAIEVVDVDDDHLLFAEIGIDIETYQRGVDELRYEQAANIHAVFDTESGILFLVGHASKDEYQAVIRSVAYAQRRASDSVSVETSRNIYVKVNDGKATSPVYQRHLLLQSGLALEIPTAFTPNNDFVNDTWQITLLQHVEQFSAHIRIYDKRGNIVFESDGLEREWDGYYNGAPLPADVYFFTINMDLSYRKVNYKGIVSILR